MAVRKTLENTGNNFHISLMDDDEKIGFLAYTYLLDEIEILDVFVEEKYRRQGYGKMLIEEVLKNIKPDLEAKVFLEVREGNEPAIGLYLSYNFFEIGRRKKYYVDPVEDAIIMQKIVNTKVLV
jgi:ribosomal-protein-alanine N-acetyltransferase